MTERRIDPATGREYTVDPQTGATAWVENSETFQQGQTAPSAPGGTAPWRSPTAPPPKKKHRIFLWVFLVIQAIFLVWIITAIARSSGDATDCGTLTQQECNDAKDVGTGIGVFGIVIFWLIIDFLLGVTYVIYRLAKRP